MESIEWLGCCSRCKAPARTVSSAGRHEEPRIPQTACRKCGRAVALTVSVARRERPKFSLN